MGTLYSHGVVVKQDYKKAADWFKKGARLRNFASMLFLGTGYEKKMGVEYNPDKAKLPRYIDVGINFLRRLKMKFIN